MLRALAIALLVPLAAAAQTLPATHAYSGLDATSARARLERDGPRTYGPRFEAAAMPAAPTLNFLPGQADSRPQPVPPIRVVRPTFRLPERDLGIADVQDILFFAETRLARVRLHLRAAGEPLAKRWTGQLRRYFDFLDRDGDGVLNHFEAEFALSNAGVVQMLRTGYAYQRPDDAARTFADVDKDGDGKVSFDEFAHYYAPSAGQVVAALPNPNRDVYADTLTDELFKLLDTDKDGRLSRAELNAIERLLPALDADEDECLSALEVAPNVFNGRTPPRPAPVAKGPLSDQPMLAFRPGAVPDSVLETILARYDRDHNGRLSKAENPFADELFRRLDKDGNGELSGAELAAWKDGAPGLEIEMVLGSKASDSHIRLVPRADGKPAALAAGFRAAGDGAAVLTVGTQSIQLSCYTPPGIYGQPERPNSLLSFPGGKGFITETDVAGPQFQAFRILFDMIDRDGDGKITRAEYDAFVALQKSFTRLPLSLVYQAQTPSLFQLLDTNGDGRLSVREVREAWARLIALEPTDKGFVTRAALRPHGAIRFGRSAESVMVNPSQMYTQQPVRQSTRGPLWFRKFDRNGDGEVSRSEFPGATEEFDRIDTNRDGYISVEEAEAADKKLRARK